MDWLQFQFELATDDLDIVEQRLEALNCLSITLTDAEDNPIMGPAPGETPLWQKLSLLALFPESVDPDLLKYLFFDRLSAQVIGWRHKKLEDQDWVRAWMDDFKPMQFGDNLWICPSWTLPPNPQAVNLMLDPGLAFGSGTHPTTALCLEWLDANPPDNQSVIDYGCGSGVLFLAALKLGARQVTGIDIDPQALQASKDNAQRNQIAANLYHLQDADAADPEPVDLLMANILAQPLIILSSQISQLVRRTGSIILSGVLDEQADNVVKAYSPWFSITNRTSKQGWHLIEGRRNQTDN